MVGVVQKQPITIPDMVFFTKRKLFVLASLLVSPLFFTTTAFGYFQEPVIGPTPGDTITEEVVTIQSQDTIFNYPEELIADQIKCLESSIPLHYNKTIQGFINYFTVRKRSFTKTMLERKHLYFPIFEEALKRHGLPDELKYLSIVESGLNPKAHSGAGALGLWQFISSTGRQYGLYQDAYVDERMDPYEATEAGCRYLKFLYNTFGDWELALSAYNCGPGNVRRAIRRSGNKTGFWEIYANLPRETRSYVPMFVAVTYIMNHYADYNLKADSLVPYIASDTIHVNQHLDIAAFASQLNQPIEHFQQLNPHIKKNVIPKHLHNYVLRVPKEGMTILASNRQAIMDSASIAMPGQSEPVLLAANNPEKEVKVVHSTSTQGRKKVVHTVSRGDAIGRIADLYNVGIAELRKWNNIRGNTIKVGQRLAVWVSEHTYQAVKGGDSNSFSESMATRVLQSSKAKVYQVQPGDTLWSISKIHGGIPVEKIKELNNLKTNELKPGQKLILG